ncbi:MAG TPA: GntR family transcriptional regulator [Burkholderiales bacterium]|nr:GntR family transcriptional regulator [Burkholderiales bacterium]
MSNSGADALAPHLKPLERAPALGDRVYQTLRQLLREGRMGAGEPLRELPLAAQLGVSRTPIREALARLASEGLVAVEGRSYVSGGVSSDDVDDIYELRLLLEPAAIRQAAAVARDPQAHAPLGAAVRECAAAHRAGDADAFMTGNARFRTVWLGMVRNRQLVRAIERYASHVQHLRRITLSDARVRAVALAGMKRISAALASGDGERAGRAMRDQLAAARQALQGAGNPAINRTRRASALA